LPEIYRSGIYKKYSMTIVEYAGKYGDIARSTVIKRLRLEKNLKNKPALREAISIAGVHKVAMVAKLADAKTDKAFADKVMHMSKAAVQSLSREIRSSHKPQGDGRNGGDSERSLFLKNLENYENNSNQKCHAPEQNINIKMDEEMTFLFLKLKKQLEKNRGVKEMSNKEAMRRLLKSVTGEDFEKQKQQSVTGETFRRQTCERKMKKKQKQKAVSGETFRDKQNETKISKKKSQKNINNETSRYINSQTKRVALEKTNHKCAYPHCNKPPTTFHHRERFSISKNHQSIIPLCKIHHEFAHNGVIPNEKQSPKKWLLKPTILLNRVDLKMRKCRNSPPQQQ